MNEGKILGLDSSEGYPPGWLTAMMKTRGQEGGFVSRIEQICRSLGVTDPLSHKMAEKILDMGDNKETWKFLNKALARYSCRDIPKIWKARNIWLGKEKMR